MSMRKPKMTLAPYQHHYACLKKIRIRGDVFNNTLNYSLVKDPKFARFYLLSKIHKRFLNVPGRPVISNC